LVSNPHAKLPWNSQLLAPAFFLCNPVKHTSVEDKITHKPTATIRFSASHPDIWGDFTFRSPSKCLQQNESGLQDKC
jgi:hypothetical protein